MLTHKFAVNKTIEEQNVEGSAEKKYVARYFDTNEVSVDYAWMYNMLKAGISNNQIMLDLATRPPQVNKPDQDLELKTENVYNPNNDHLKTTNTVRYGSPLMGPLRAWLTVRICLKNFKA